MTTYPQHDVYVEDEEGALSAMPFNVAHALLRLGWHTAWGAVLRAEEAAFQEAGEDFAKRKQDHKKLAAEAREAWQTLALPWASGPRGGREGGEVVSNVLTMAKTAATHCAAMRIYKEESGKSLAKLLEPAKEPYTEFESASRVLEDMHAVLAHALYKRIVELIWAVNWHVANTVAAKREEQEEEEEEKEEDGEEDEDEDEDEEEEEEDEEDEEKLFGKDYPGSSDDPVEDMRGILGVLYELFSPKEPLRGVRVSMASGENLPSILESIAQVPGAFGEPGLNAVRLVLPDWSGCNEALDSAAGELLLKAEALELQVVLELPAVPGKAYEDWLRKVAKATQSLKCVVGVAVPRVLPARANGLLAALRQGGLTQDRCTCFLQLPTGDVDEDQEELYKSDYSADASELPVWLADGNTMLEAPADPGKDIPDEEWPVGAQVLLDAASMLSEDLEGLHLVSSWSLAKLRKCKLEDVDETELYREFAQRMLAVVQVAPRGWFFESWGAPSGGDDAEHRSLDACCKRGWLDLASEVQVMYPHGSSHTVSLVYLHGFTCDGYSYLAEPHYFYRPKQAKKKKKASKAKKEEDDEIDMEELEPFPGLKVVLPTAPRRPITCYKGEMQHAWHDYITDHEGEREDELSAEDLQQTTERIHRMLDAEAAKVGAKNVYLGGASQGCGTALHIGLTYPGDLGGIIGTMGHLLSCTPIKREWLAKKIPVFTFNGLDDELMRWDLWVKATYQRLVDAGADVKMATDEGVDHGEEEDKWIRRFLTEVLKNSAAKNKKKKGK